MEEHRGRELMGRCDARVTEQPRQEKAVLLGGALVRVARCEGGDEIGGGLVADVGDDL
jgi:hypothetical protein